MIMPRGQQLLLPVKPWFIWLTLLWALMLNMLINMAWIGRASWVPDILALVVVFWCIHQPSRIGVGVAFGFGLVMDSHMTGVLGQQALCYSLLGYLAVAIHRRLLWFPLLEQTIQIFPLFGVVMVVQLVVRWIIGGDYPEWPYFIAPLLQALLWPVVTWLLLAPQKKAPDPDNERPL